MSLIDIFQSFAYIVSALPLPRETQYYMAMGNAATCSAQGFLVQFGGLGVPCYNASLCFWFLLSIKHNIRPNVFQETYEKWTHIVSIGLPLSVAVLCAAFDEYHPRGSSICWLGVGKYSQFFIYFSFSIASICFVIISFCMGSLYISIRMKETQLRRYSTGPSGLQWRPDFNLGIKQEVAKQGLLFTFAMFSTFIFPALNIICYPKSEKTLHLFIELLKSFTTFTS